MCCSGKTVNPDFMGACSNCKKIVLLVIGHELVVQLTSFKLVFAGLGLKIPKFKKKIRTFSTCDKETCL
jgi:hypothetical protein